MVLRRSCSWCEKEGTVPPPAPGEAVSHGICEHHQLRETAEAMKVLTQQWRALNTRLSELGKDLILLAIEREQAKGPTQTAVTFARGQAHGFREAARVLGEVQDCGVKYGR